RIPMARSGCNGFGSVGSASQFRYRNLASGHFVPQPVKIVVRPKKALLLLVCLGLLGCWLPVLASAQDDDVHIQPRQVKKSDAGTAVPTTDPSGIADPSLRTHTKPIKKEVDLVLVPVTITDPMNRLVTGLEKDNFLLTDNGKPQEIRHFSSEDAPIS